MNKAPENIRKLREANSKLEEALDLLVMGTNATSGSINHYVLKPLDIEIREIRKKLSRITDLLEYDNERK